jgi:signal transduction histidine kinase/DNA-binding response OmpR family regulator
MFESSVKAGTIANRPRLAPAVFLAQDGPTASGMKQWMKTLLVQDSSANELLSRCLVAHGYAVTSCSPTAAGEELYRNESFSLIVLDVDNVGQWAREFCRHIRAHPKGKTSFILASLPPDRGELASSLLNSGVDDVLLEPYGIEDLKVRLASVEHQVKERLDFRRIEQVLSMRSQQQVAIAALGQCALTADLPTVMDLVSRFVMHTLEVEFCSLMELCDDGQSLLCVAGLGWRDGVVGSVVQPGTGSLTGLTMMGEDLVVHELERDQRLKAPDAFLRDHGVASGISVAVKGKESVLGVLGAYTGSGRHFAEDDLHFLQGLANVVGAAIERKRGEAEIQRHQGQIQHLQRLESIGQLTAGIAHDYNNVLTIIHGHVTLVLGDTNLPPGSAGSLKTALDAVERASNLTRQLLAFSRKQSIQPEPADLNTIIGNVTKLLDRLLGENIKLDFKPCSAATTIEADTGMMEQVIMNLAVNARDAMPRGGKLFICTSPEQITPERTQQTPEARAGDFVCLKVTDTGCGMDARTLERIFEPFFTTKEPGKGTGLGLATVYGIVKQHQGWIEVQSQPGKGTTFLIFLPTLTKAAEAAPVAPAESATRGGNETILLVEDEPSLRELTRLILEDLGYKVVDAGSGLEAVRIWAEQKDRIQLVLTDLVMPDGMTGFDLAARLQSESSRLKIVVTSGYDVDKVTQGLPPNPGFHFLRKPYRTETLARVMREALDG